MEIKQTALVPFGKYKGRPVEEAVLSDPSYFEWAMAQASIRAKFATLCEKIKELTASSDSCTPEHNQMQAIYSFSDSIPLRRLVDKLEFVCSVSEEEGSKILKKAQSWMQEWNWPSIDNLKREDFRGFGSSLEGFDFYRNLQSRIDWWGGWDNYRPGIESVEVEAIIGKGYHADVLLLVNVARRRMLHSQSDYIFHSAFGDDLPVEVRPIKVPNFPKGGIEIVEWEPTPVVVELKPQLGDDYPAVLRKIKTCQASLRSSLSGYYHFVVLCDRFEASVSFENVRRMFKDSDILLLLSSELR